MSRAKPLYALLLLVLLLCAFAEPAFAQCSMCRSVLAQSPEGQRIAGELNKAILLLFVAPYLIMGGCAAWILRSRLGGLVRRAVRLLVLPR